jgi:hypothetical protein
LSQEESIFRVAVFLTCAGEEAAELVDTFTFDDEGDREKIDCVLKKFEEYCVLRTNETYETYRFNQRGQKEDESVDAYLAELRKLAKNCHFEAMEDRLIRDRLVAGIKSDEVRRKLLEEKDLDLARALEVCRIHSATTAQAQDMAAGDDLHKVHARGGSKGSKPSMKKPTGESSSEHSSDTKTCKFCGKKHQQSKELCPAWGKTCNKCKGQNHFASVCRKKMKSHMKYVDEHDDDVDAFDDYANDVDDAMHVHDDDHVLHVGENAKKGVYAKMVIGQKEVMFQLDTGASINCMSKDTYVKVTGDTKLRYLDKSDKKLVMYDGSEIKPLGEKILDVTNPKNDKQYRVRFQVVEGKSKPILGLRAVQGMELLKLMTENIAVLGESGSLLAEFKDVFAGDFGTLQGDLKMETDKNVPPVKLPCRKWPLALKDKVRLELDRLQQIGVVKPVDTPTSWISSVVVTTKSNGSVRLCIDPKPLNKALKRNDYPMKTIDDVLEELKVARYFSHFDAKNGF